MKLCVFGLFQLLPWIAWVGDWALRWTEGNKRLQVAFVMLVFPLIMNAMQYWIIDSFIKDDKRVAHAEDDGDGEGHGEAVGRGSEDEAFAVDDDSEDESDEEAGLVKKKGLERESLKEANPTAVPIRQEYDPDRDGAGSSGSDGSGVRAEEALRKELEGR